jgi:hypothetical protein
MDGNDVFVRGVVDLKAAADGSMEDEVTVDGS